MCGPTNDTGSPNQKDQRIQFLRLPRRSSGPGQQNKLFAENSLFLRSRPFRRPALFQGCNNGGLALIRRGPIEKPRLILCGLASPSPTRPSHAKPCRATPSPGLSRWPRRPVYLKAIRACRTKVCPSPFLAPISSHSSWNDVPSSRAPLAVTWMEPFPAPCGRNVPG